MEQPISLWLAFKWSGPLDMCVMLSNVIVPIVTFRAARKWHWPQTILKLFSIVPIALIFIPVLQHLGLIHEVVFGEKGDLDSGFAALAALGQIRLLLCVGFTASVFALIASCARPQSVS